ncbi:TetR/AcrR family transcriptional regulator [Rhizobiaceae bacterium n13]|uniref:TetR/AcrR family transcriptional regulator n=2 Tax=Ferirhizobium litorale TaxID=2927786 RepID=A0AAE3U188_9HYPH|nr:TetR/AcrR family transcriptional regulator [Fererhizobium litorale]MDI7921372.1 TetR/AcrR family transcriptional regulator [Fererhizobium litorale]
MQDIIRASDLSAGAVYSYFKSKDDLIFAAVATSLDDLRTMLDETMRRAPAKSADDLIGLLLPAITKFAARDGYDLRRIALLGWSEAQRSERLRVAIQSHYAAFRADLAKLAASWRPSSNAADADAMAKLLLTVLLGAVVQSAIMGDATAEDIARGLRLLTQA